MMTDSEEVLRRLTIGDRAYCRSLVATGTTGGQATLDARSLALLQLGATMMVGASTPVWRQRVSDALEGGLSGDEIVEALTALAPTLGIDRIVAVAPDVARALDYDVDAALERLDP
jgi:alkylhydroperoxidase/carboxymuconolactone decarboxylase family protein YurZ